MNVQQLLKFEPFEGNTVAIDGVTYEFCHISPRLLNKLLIRALKLIGKPLAAGMDTEIGENRDEMLTAILTMVFDAADEDVIDSIIFDILSETICVGKGNVKEKFDLVFKGKFIHMWKVVAHALKFYFSDFFEEGSSVISQLMQMMDMMGIKGSTPPVTKS